MPLSDEQKSMIKNAMARVLNERIEAGRLSLKPLGICLPSHQVTAEDSCIFSLHKNESNYFLVPLAETKFVPKLHGTFLFVITSNQPSVVYCSTPSGSMFGNDCGLVDGHTSLSKRQLALYAGELLFSHGSLIGWNNASGHYAPPPNLVKVNILPYVSRLLPSHLFDPCEFTPVGSSNRKYSVEDNSHSLRDKTKAMLKARGYVLRS